MKTETVNNVVIPKIGFGTWTIGGGSSRDVARDAASLTALHAALEIGYTHFDTAERYAAGHAEELVGRAVRESHLDRTRLFITTKVWPDHLAYDDVLRSFESSLKRLDMDYVDLYLIHWPSDRINLEDTFRALNKLVRDRKALHLGVSNFNLKLLTRSRDLSETPLFTDQVPYHLHDKSYAKNGVLDFCLEHEILLTAYSPIKHQNVSANKILREIALAHSATPVQIALAWLVAQPRVITIPMSYNPEHIKENFEAAQIELSIDEMARLNNAR